MIINVVTLVTMTLLSSHVKLQAVSTRQPKPRLCSTSLSDNEWKVRPFHPSTDQSSLEEMCRNTFGGSDYLPKMALNYVKDPNSYFQAICPIDENACAAVANMRMLNKNTAWLEAVRTLESYRNNGLAFRLLQSMLRDATEMGLECVCSCTVQSNKAMRRVFEKLGMTELTRIQMIKFDSLRSLPGWAANDEASQQHLLASLDIQHLVSESARASKISTVQSYAELQSILRDIQSRGGCGLMPGIYEVIDGRLRESLAQQLVFSLHDASGGPAVMAFQRDKRISTLKSNWSMSVSGTLDEHLQAALWHACSPTVQSKLSHGTDDDVSGFTLAFDGAIATDGPFCSALPLTEDTCFVYSTSLNDPTIQ